MSPSTAAARSAGLIGGPAAADAGRGRCRSAATATAQSTRPASRAAFARKPVPFSGSATAIAGARAVPAHHRRAGGLLGRRAQTITAASSNGNGAAAAADGEVENVVIIGSGPAGYTASIYAGRANLRPLCFEGLSAGGVRGGQLMTTTEVENFPGFPEGITGPDLMERMREQAERWGAVLETEDVVSVDLSARPFVVKSTERTVRAHAIIVATGATAKRLGIPSEERFWSNGISACAICDGASPIFKGEELAVVGGGDTATEEALYLTKYAKHVHLLVRGPEMRASKTMQDRVLRHENVTVHLSTAIVDAVGDEKTGRMTHLRVQDTQTGQESDLGVRGLFYGIGHKPNSSFLGGQVELDDAGYVVVREGVRTSVEGVFAAGDLHDTEWRQAITAAGSGCMSAIATERYLAEKGLATIYVAEEKPAEAEEEKQQKQKQKSSGSEESEKEFDLSETCHTGQFALRKLYHESDRPVVVFYSSPTCGPCRTLKPIWKSLAKEYEGRIHYVAIDIEQDPEIAEAAGVNGTPTVHLFYQKERLHNLPGVKMKSDYRKLIDPLVAAEEAAVVQEVEQVSA